jgi:hypothetical protein
VGWLLGHRAARLCCASLPPLAESTSTRYTQCVRGDPDIGVLDLCHLLYKKISIPCKACRRAGGRKVPTSWCFGPRHSVYRTDIFKRSLYQCRSVLRCLQLQYSEYRARIFKHLMDAEKSTFRRELSFQRSKSKAGLTVATIFCALF